MGKVSPCEKLFMVDGRDLVIEMLCGPLENFFLRRKISPGAVSIRLRDHSTVIFHYPFNCHLDFILLKIF